MNLWKDGKVREVFPHENFPVSGLKLVRCPRSLASTLVV